MKIYTRSVAKILAAGMFFALFLLAIFSILFYNWYSTSLNTSLGLNSDPVRFVVVEGWSFYRTSLELERKGLIKDSRVLKIIAKLNKDKTSIKAGE